MGAIPSIQQIEVMGDGFLGPRRQRRYHPSKIQGSVFPENSKPEATGPGETGFLRFLTIGDTLFMKCVDFIILRFKRNLPW
jgi:hypothetical protein